MTVWFKVRKTVGLTLFWGGVITGVIIMVLCRDPGFTLGSKYLDITLVSTIPIGYVFWVSTWD